MATVTVSIGSNQSIDTETTASCSGGSSPWVTTFGTTPSGIAVGDLATGSDSFANTFIWLVTAISGDDITLKYISGGMSATSPCAIGSFGGGGVITFKRYYSTITLWEAGLDDTGLYSSGDDAVGECYDDSTFDERPTINGGNTVGLDSVTLSVASGERHDGTAGNGARLVLTANWSGSVPVFDIDYEMYVTVEWLEVDGAGYGSTSSTPKCFDLGGASSGDLDYKTVSKCIIHHFSSKYKFYAVYTHDYSSEYKINNNFIYNIESSNAGSASADNRALYVYNPRTASYWDNNTIHDLYCRDAGDEVDDVYGIYGDNDAEAFCNNNLVTDPGRGGTPGDCFSSHQSTGDYDYNLSSDDTAQGSNSLINKSAADQYESSTEDSEDLHLKSGADAIGAGKDLGTTGSANTDINGRDRDAEGDTWDIGAHQTVTEAAVTANPAFLMLIDT